MLLLSHALGIGPRAGFWLASGLAAGNLFHTLLLILGLAALLQWNPTLLQTLKLVGVAYMLWLIWQTWRPPKSAEGAAPQAIPSARLRYFWRGFISNALNPKILLFFGAFVPQFLDESGAWSISMQMGVMGISFVLLVWLLYGGLGLLAGKCLPQRVAVFNPVWGQWALSVVFGLLAIRLLLPE